MAPPPPMHTIDWEISMLKNDSHKKFVMVLHSHGFAQFAKNFRLTVTIWTSTWCVPSV